MKVQDLSVYRARRHLLCCHNSEETPKFNLICAVFIFTLNKMMVGTGRKTHRCDSIFVFPKLTEACSMLGFVVETL